MASEGPNTPLTTANNATVGTVAWTSTSNATASDDTYATVTLATGEVSQYLLLTKFGFSAVNGTVNGVLVEVEENGIGVADSTVKLKLPGGFSGNNKATSTALDIVDTIVSYGGAADTWASGVVPGDVLTPLFGFGYSIAAIGAGGTGNVDFGRITVTYTAAAVAEYPRAENPVHHILTRRMEVVSYKWVGRRWFEEKIEFVGFTERGPQFRETRYAGSYSNRSLNHGYEEVQRNLHRHEYRRNHSGRLHRDSRCPTGVV